MSEKLSEAMNEMDIKHSSPSLQRIIIKVATNVALKSIVKPALQKLGLSDVARGCLEMFIQIDELPITDEERRIVNDAVRDYWISSIENLLNLPIEPIYFRLFGKRQENMTENEINLARVMKLTIFASVAFGIGYASNALVVSVGQGSIKLEIIHPTSSIIPETSEFTITKLDDCGKYVDIADLYYKHSSYRDFVAKRIQDTKESKCTTCGVITNVTTSFYNKESERFHCGNCGKFVKNPG